VSGGGQQPQDGGFWGRATVALVLVLYAWSMMGVTLYLRYADPADGPSKALAQFRRMVMGQGVILLGAVAVLAAVILAILARRRRRVAWVALGLAAAWVAVGLALWPL
jgi:hypothetical protein